MSRGVVRPLLLRKQLPAERRDHQPAGDAHDRKLDAEHLQHPGAEHYRTEQEHKAVDRDRAREPAPLLTRQARCQPEKEGCPFDRIDDRKKSGESQQEGTGNRVHFVGARNSMRARPFIYHPAVRASAVSMNVRFYLVTGTAGLAA